MGTWSAPGPPAHPATGWTFGRHKTLEVPASTLLAIAPLVRVSCCISGDRRQLKLHMTAQQARAYAQAFRNLWWHTSRRPGRGAGPPVTRDRGASAGALRQWGEALQPRNVTGTAAGPTPLKFQGLKCSELGVSYRSWATATPQFHCESDEPDQPAARNAPGRRPDSDRSAWAKPRPSREKPAETDAV